MVAPPKNSTSRQFRKSSFSPIQPDFCVEVAISTTEVAVRDSKDPKGPILSFSPKEWKAFVAGVKIGEFDPCDKTS